MLFCVQVLNVLTEDFGYHKVSIFSPYWMINKTGRDIEYLVSLKREEEEGGRRERSGVMGLSSLQVDGKAIKHPSSKSLILLSTSNPKNNVRTPHLS